MRANGLFGGKYAKVEKREYELPALGPNDALVEVRACGVCGTDLNFLRDCEGPLRPMGHELSGVVLEIGSAVSNVTPGAKVVVEDLAYCGVCRDCQEGRIHLCRNMLTGGGRPGMADYFVIDARCLVPFDGLSFEAASLTEPLAVGICAVEESDIPLGGSVVVFGHGPIGLFAARCALLRGASFVAVVGTSRDTPLGEKRFAVAEALGCHATFESRKCDVANAVREVLPAGADRVIVTSPPRTVPDAIKCAHFGGRVALLGIDFGGGETIPLDVNYAVFNKIDVKGVIAEPALHFPTSISLLKSKAVDPDAFLTDFCSFDTLGPVCREVLERRRASVKTCLIPHGAK